MIALELILLLLILIIEKPSKASQDNPNPQQPRQNQSPDLKPSHKRGKLLGDDVIGQVAAPVNAVNWVHVGLLQLGEEFVLGEEKVGL